MAKQIIINADDLGLSTGTNKAIEIGHRKGIITSASLMAGGASLENALTIIKRNPKLGIGIHLSLDYGKCVSSIPAVKKLVDSQGYFNKNFGQILLLSYVSQSFLKQVEIELESQIKKSTDKGIKLDHLNGQSHIQMIPPIFKLVVKLAKKYKIKVVRVSREANLLPFSFYFFYPPKLVNLFKIVLLTFFSFINRKQLENLNLNRFWGLSYTGQVDKSALLEIASSNNFDLGSSKIEIVVHPGLHLTNKDKNFDFGKRNLVKFLKDKNRKNELKVICDKTVAKKYKNYLTFFGQPQ